MQCQLQCKEFAYTVIHSDTKVHCTVCGLFLTVQTRKITCSIQDVVKFVGDERID